MERATRIGDGRIVFLDYLRGLACMLVVVGHVALLGVNDPGTVAAWLPFIGAPIFGPDSPGLNPLNSVTTSLMVDYGISVGPLGVAIFFLISGFVITRASDRERAAVFAVRRFFRIVPVALAVSLSTYALTVYLCRQHGAEAPGDLRSAIATGFALQGIFGTFSTIPVIWSLSVELFFYILIAALTAGVGRIGSTTILIASLCCAAFATASHAHGVASALPSALARPVDHIGYLAFHTCFLLIGAAIFRASEVRWSARSGGTVAAVVLIHFAALRADAVVSGIGATGTTTGDDVAALAIFGAALALGLRWRALHPLRFFGDVSYPLYLLHIPLAWAIMAWLAGQGVGLLAGVWLAIGATVAAAWIVHVTIERWSQAAGRAISHSVARSSTVTEPVEA